MTPEQLAKSGSEHGEQRAYFAALREWSVPIFDMTFAIPNGGSRGDTAESRGRIGNQMKAEGVKPGVPDIMIAWPYQGQRGHFYAGLFLELKRKAAREKARAKGRLGEAQEPWHERLRKRGYYVAVVYGWEDALAATKRYFGVNVDI